MAKKTIKINTRKVEQKLSQLNPYRPSALVTAKKTGVLAWFRSRDNKNTNEIKKQSAFKKLHEAAEKGDHHAQNNLGLIYYTGTYVSSDYIEAIKWISQAAEQGNIVAQYNLGKIYYEGQCVTQDCDQAIKLFVKVVNQTKSEKQLIESAKFTLFVLFLYKADIITSDDIVVINKLLHEVATTREFIFSHYIKLALADEQIFLSIRKLLKWLLPKISFILGETQIFLKDIENDLDNQGLLIEFLVSGLNHLKSAKANNLNAIIQEIQELSIKFFYQLAKEGKASAQFALGNIYLKGSDDMTQSIQDVIQKVVSPTINQINERFHHAKNEINKISGNTQWFEHFKQFENMLNTINMIGAIQKTAPQQNYQQDYQKAAEWFTKAAIQGLPKAQYRLGTLYTKGKGVVENDQKAIECFKAINPPKDEDNETKFITVLSQYELGKIYKKQAHYQEAKKWLEKVSKFDEVISEELYDKIDTKRLNDSRKSAQEMLIDIAKIEEKETAKKELEDVMGMFAHKFRGSLQSIEYLEKDETILEDVHTMDGLLNIFSLISTDASIIREKLLQDMEGEGTLLLLLEQTLIMSLASVLALKNREKIRQHYINYANKTEQVPISTTRKQWKTNHLDLELQLQKEWQHSFIELKRQPSLDKIITWLNERFFPIEIQGFAEVPIHFERYGATESILLVIMPEIFTNVLKYYASETRQAVQLHWNCGTQFCQFLCTNPTTYKEQRIGKGSGKGHHFLSLIARKLGGNFPAPPFVENYAVEFNIPNYLLMENNI
jgi:TPR repeat protein